MPIALGSRASNAPPPLGVPWRVFGLNEGQIAYPTTGNWIAPGASVGAQTQVFNRPENFVLKVGASYITRVSAGASFTRYDCQLKLVTNDVYANDMNGYCIFQKANYVVGTIDNNWKAISIEGIWACAANQRHYVNLLSVTDNATLSYYRHQTHLNMWAYTFAEGMF